MHAGLVDGPGARVNKEIKTTIEEAEKAGVAVSTLPKHDLNMLSDNRPHQVRPKCSRAVCLHA